ncbi:hypothetical protein G7Y89_g3672 [Cudoniella acicularis]|uniref:Uncharacterized protein n=1 Tax=Cudoniella acicularis TaxID=354080 RepID=A0A8H4RTW7_9HELO|nr:hypothetical protein G7Y89_g3672 [Cudoniella acicularis]
MDSLDGFILSLPNKTPRPFLNYLFNKAIFFVFFYHILAFAGFNYYGVRYGYLRDGRRDREQRMRVFFDMVVYGIPACALFHHTVYTHYQVFRACLWGADRPLLGGLKVYGEASLGWSLVGEGEEFRWHHYFMGVVGVLSGWYIGISEDWQHRINFWIENNIVDNVVDNLWGIWAAGVHCVETIKILGYAVAGGETQEQVGEEGDRDI